MRPPLPQPAPLRRRPSVAAACLLMVCLAWGLDTGHAGDSTLADLRALFEEANQYYDRGQYPEAIAAYGQILATGRASATLYFNLGNAYFRAGQIGRALEHYRRAERLDPRDPDITANLRFARTLVHGSLPPALPIWRRSLPNLNLDSWTLLTMAGVWLGLGGMAGVQWRTGWRRWARWPIRLAVALTALAAIGLWFTAREELLRESAVVIQNDTVLHHGPLEESPSLETLKDGQELTVTDRKGEWLQVTGSDRGMGWLKAERVVLLSSSLGAAGTPPPR